MVMIPTDVGVQVRSQTEAPLHSLRPIADIPSDLPDLQKGQVFRAHIQEALPENTFKALVAGRMLTLSLPEGAKTGDTLDLVVIDRTPRAIVAKMAERGLVAGGEPYQHATLSRTGQLIASLLAREGEPATPAALNRGRSLLPQAPVNAAALVQGLPPKLAQAVSISGLFYEAHQVQWALGQRPLASLLAEPQGQHSNPLTLAAFGEAGTAQEAAAKSALAARRESAAASVSSSPPPVSLLQALFGGDTAAASATAGAAAAESHLPASPTAAALVIPDDLRPLVQQQLEAAATQRLTWHGEIWPKQTMDWEIERDAREGDSAPGEAAAWATSLRLSLPRLGAIDARLQLSGQNVRLVLHTLEASTATDLDAAIPSLQQALAAAGLTLLGVQTQHDAG
jgi:hypothetical protein